MAWVLLVNRMPVHAIAIGVYDGSSCRGLSCIGLFKHAHKEKHMVVECTQDLGEGDIRKKEQVFPRSTARVVTDWYSEDICPFQFILI